MDAPTAPSLWNLFWESRILTEVGRLTLQSPSLAFSPRGSGQPVLVFPGYLAGDLTTLPLRNYLCFLGYRVRGWGLGINRGDVAKLMPRVLEMTDKMAQSRGEPVRLLGWSLGGVLARETARERPELVRQVVTLGTPVIGGPKYTTVAKLFETRTGLSVDDIAAAVREREKIPIRVPVTAVYSRLDGVVSWQACIDRNNPHVEHVEVRSSHAGLGLDPDVFRILAQRLAPQ